MMNINIYIWYIYTKGKETFGFKSLKPAPSIDGLKDFEGKLIDLIQSVETKRVKNEVQDILRRDAEKVRNDEKLYISADKTTNFYKMDNHAYNDLLKKNVTNDYKKTHSDTVEKTNEKQIDLDDRVFATQKRDAYITIKDHKANYLNDTSTRSAASSIQQNLNWGKSARSWQKSWLR